MGFRTRFLVYILPLVVLLPVCYLAFYVHRTTAMLEEDLNERGFLLARALGQATEIGLLARDRSLFGSLLDGVLRERDVTYLVVYDRQGKPFDETSSSHEGEALSQDVLTIVLETRESLQRTRQGPTEAAVRDFLSPIFANSLGEPQRVIGISKVSLSTAHILRERNAILLTTLLMTGAFIIIGSTIAVALARGITRPLRVLTEGVEAVASGDLARVISIQSTDEIGRFGAAFNLMTAALKQRTAELVRRNEDMRLVLDNVDQALVTVDRQGGISSERSAKFDAWFNWQAGGTAFWDLLMHENSNQADLFRLGYEQLIEGILPTELAISQLPKDFGRGDRRYSLSLTPLSIDGNIEGGLLVISDITDQLQARRAESLQREQLALLEHAIRDRTGFAEFVQQTGALVHQVRGDDFDDAERIRAIHTIKGNGGQFGVTSVSEAAHRLEQAYVEEDAEGVTTESRRLFEAWDGYALRVTALLGESSADGLEITDEQLAQMLRWVRERRPHGEIGRVLAGIRDQPVKRRFQRVAMQISELSKRLGKGEPEVSLKGAETRLPIARYAALWTSFVHVVRNVVDHGFETEEERLTAGKPARNRVTLEARMNASCGVVIEVADDGRGIDWARIKDKAAALKLPCSTQHELVDALFSPGLSTTEAPTLISGRGLGMAAVRDACRALGGFIEVESQRGRGTLLRFTFPQLPTDEESPLERADMSPWPPS